MKFVNKNFEQLDTQIQDMFDLSMPKSAFNRVIPTKMMKSLRSQYVEYLEQKNAAQKQIENYRPVSTQVIKVNIAPLREAGYCCCPEELAAACESLLKQQNENTVSATETSEVSENKKLTSVENGDIDMADANETTNSKTSDDSSEVCDLEKAVPAKKQKAYPAKIGTDISKRNNSDKNEASHQVRTKKRKYFTKYMSNEFSKDTNPVSMNDMDSKTQKLFSEQEFNELVSEITGMN